MAKLDGTGPQGAGPQTGRGMGPCGRGFGVGLCGRRMGLGRRFLGQKEGKELLKEEEKMLEEELKAIKEDIKSLEDKK